MKITALNSIHKSLGAKMVNFAGFEMPLSYTSVLLECASVRNSVGVFDVSHMGNFILSGENAIDLIQLISSNDVSKLAIGEAQYAYMPNAKGGVVDDLLIYRMEKSAYMLVVNASNITKDWEWISRHNQNNVRLQNLSDEMSLLAVQGPSSAFVLQKISSIDLKKIPYYKFMIGDMGGVSDVIISATGYTGAGGFELYAHNKDVIQLWNAVFDAGKEEGIAPIGLAARDSLRLEMGFCLYGNELNENTSPLEAGLGWVTKFSKKFINSEELLHHKENGLSQKLVGFKMKERAIPRIDCMIVDKQGIEIGRVTSGSQSPTLKQGIGLGYVKTDFAKVQKTIFIKIRDKYIPAEVVKPPFI